MKAPEISVFGGGHWKPPDPIWILAEQIGRLIALKGFTLVTGGYQGVMDAAGKGAMEIGSSVRGILCKNCAGRIPSTYNTHVTIVNDFSDRLSELLKVKRTVILPGKIGTYTELVASIDMMDKKEMRFCAIHRYWKKDVEILLKKEFIDEKVFERIYWFNNAEDLEEYLSYFNGE